MKNKIRFLWTAVIITALASSMVTACDNGGGGGGGSNYNLGDTGPGGGKILYYSTAGFTVQGYTGASGSFAAYTAHYLEAAPDDQGELAWVSLEAFWETELPGTETGIGTGRKNTSVILAADPNAPAAKACKNYKGGGKTDWFLPSKDELNELYKNKDKAGNFKNVHYRSSSEFSYRYAYYQDFSDGYQNGRSKNNNINVRAVRAF